MCVQFAISYLRKGNTNTTCMTVSYRRRFRSGRGRAERTRLHTRLLHCWWQSQGYQRLCEVDWGGPRTHSTRITWASVRGPHSQPPPHPAPSETLALHEHSTGLWSCLRTLLYHPQACLKLEEKIHERERAGRKHIQRTEQLNKALKSWIWTEKIRVNLEPSSSPYKGPAAPRSPSTQTGISKYHLPPEGIRAPWRRADSRARAGNAQSESGTSCHTREQRN